MKPLIVILIVIIVIVGIVIGLIAYSYTQIQFHLENVSYRGLDFVSPSSSTIVKLIADFVTGDWFRLALTLVTGVKLGLVFGLSNHGFFPVYIPDVSYDISVNEVKIGHGQSHISSTINPGETRSFPDNVQDVKFDSVEPVISSIASSGGMANLQISGTAYFNFLGINVPVPFYSSTQINVVNEIKNQINSYISQNQQNSNIQNSNPENSNNQYSNNSPQSSAQPTLEQQLQRAKDKINAVIGNNQQCITPIQVLPINGWVFNNYPRTTTLVWLPVLGASSYTIEIDYWDPGISKWHEYQIVPNITVTTYTFDFGGATSGTWRILAVNNLGQSCSASSWWQFKYTQ